MKEMIPFTMAVKNTKHLEILSKINIQTQNFTVGHIREHERVKRPRHWAEKLSIMRIFPIHFNA